MKNHLPEYFAEFLGTALMMLFGIGAVTLMWADGSPLPKMIPSPDLRRLLTGAMFAGGATLVVLSRLGQRSGGHLNPAVTLAFWWKGQVQTVDAICYTIAQTLGAVAGVILVSKLGGVWAQQVQLGITLPGTGYSAAAAFMAEVGITFLLVFVIFYCVSKPSLAGKTPYLAGLLVAVLVFVEAPISGTSLNPARSFAPALLMGSYEHHWIYWLAPVLGALLAVLIFAALYPEKKKSGCAKLYHTEHYRCIFNSCDYTNVAAGSVLVREGEVADRAFVIERGELEVRKKNDAGVEVTIATLSAGDWVGEMALLLGLPRTATIVVSKDAQLRTVTAANFAHVIEEHPHETEQLLKQLAQRLLRADQKLIV